MWMAVAIAMTIAIVLDSVISLAIAFAISFAIASLRLSSFSNGIQYKLGEQHHAGFERCCDAGALGYPASVGLGFLPVLWMIVSKA